ncbi:hypothetical protein E4T38_02310 [Aureobasidium subglaciale]|nr:hypothetical protein E4T38_02310 [Aureobasidium subglaciale]KAI5228491.1 hypothetical protein E4T40_02089 [Aureobasidium subglaciale]KAI5232045.1 hypothetical protein E4T41_02309 [Aureobasidium subglaciale]KAI5265830.1 hypothetical protein E4T46_02087 [Aureobasidium subglaciale]
MSHPPYAWADSYGGMYPSLEQCLGVDACGNEARDPTVFRQQQPFRSAENVSATPKPSFHHHAVDHMARQQPPGPLLSSSASASKGPVYAPAPAPAPAMAASDQAACFLSPCDKPDCDEATICYDYSLPHYGDLHCSQDALSCTEAFDCAETNCNAAEWLCTDLNCHEPGCDQEHARECTPACAAAAAAAAVTVSCSDPTCSEDHLYCCLSDVCPRPHPPGTECPQPCHDQHIPSTVCHPGPAVNCTQPYGYKIPSTIATASQDTMSTSTISTPTTDSIPTPDNFQSLIEAASLMPHLGYSFPTTKQGFKMKSLTYSSAYPPRKRMRLDESNSFHDFNAPYYAPNDYWQQDLTQSFGSSQFPSASQPITASASPAIKTKVRQDKASRDLDDIAMCRWNDEHTGPCNRVFATIEDLHNHVKDHTCTLIPSKTPNRTFVCRWDGCEKDAPFGTKNHLDRHMQNHTRFKPFACNICGHRCVTQQQLNNHLTTHSREKKFKCDFPGCGKVFGVKTALSTHKRTHTNEKPFSCRWCGDSYSDSSNLSKHRKTVHEDDKTAIPCPHPGCEYRDSRAQRLERHCRDTGHGLVLLSDAHKWSEYTRKKQVRSRTASVAPSIA